MHHAYFVTGEKEAGILQSLSAIEQSLGLEPIGNPDVIVLRYGLLSVDDARELFTLACQAPTKGTAKALVISVDRLFHEAQNALLKLFEEPPEGTYLYLVIPSEGMLLPTLRSRLMPLQSSEQHPLSLTSSIADEFIASGKAGREKLVARILERTKSDREEEKQEGRREARALVEGLALASYEAYKKEGNEELKLFLEDVTAFVPILYERSAPLKQIFEHLLLVMPRGLVQ